MTSSKTGQLANRRLLLNAINTAVTKSTYCSQIREIRIPVHKTTTYIFLTEIIFYLLVNAKNPKKPILLTSVIISVINQLSSAL